MNRRKLLGLIPSSLFGFSFAARAATRAGNEIRNPSFTETHEALVKANKHLAESARISKELNLDSPPNTSGA